MQDRLKFRYFNKYSKKMVYPNNYENVNAIYECLEQQVCFDENLPILPYDHIGNGLVFMQCTGLKDKNKKLIYEGDIVKLTQDKNIYNIIFEEDKARFLISSETFDFMFSAHLIKDIKVIGNIYENPELLEVK